MRNSESNSYSTAPTVSKQKSIYNNSESLLSPITTRTLTAAVTITTVTGTTTTTTFVHWSRFRDWILLRRGDCNGNAYFEHSSEWVGFAPAGYFFLCLALSYFVCRDVPTPTAWWRRLARQNLWVRHRLSWLCLLSSFFIPPLSPFFLCLRYDWSSQSCL